MCKEGVILGVVKNKEALALILFKFMFSRQTKSRLVYEYISI